MCLEKLMLKSGKHEVVESLSNAPYASSTISHFYLICAFHNLLWRNGITQKTSLLIFAGTDRSSAGWPILVLWVNHCILYQATGDRSSGHPHPHLSQRLQGRRLGSEAQKGSAYHPYIATTIIFLVIINLMPLMFKYSLRWPIVWVSVRCCALCVNIFFSRTTGPILTKFGM